MDWIDEIVRDVAELDYSSPLDQPSVMLVKAGELRAIIEARAPRPRLPPVSDALREAARAFYNATVGQPGIRLTTANEALRDEAKAAGERLRALLVASGPNVLGNRLAPTQEER